MKTPLLLLFLIIYYQNIAQGNLQFSQVKLVSTTETVPAGKVWKLQNFLPNVSLFTDITRNQTNPTSGGIRNFIILVNGISIYLQTTVTREVGRSDSYWSQDGYATAASSSILNEPIWLSSGTTLAASTNVQFVSVIEFNVVP
jgi:hypothetical protein